MSFPFAGRSRPVLLLALFALLALGLLPAVSSADTGPASLSGEFVGTWPGATLTGGMCDVTSESTFTFEHSGEATGPYPGVYHETGRIRISPHSYEIPTAPGQFRARILEFESSFTITGAAGTVEGTKSLLPGDDTYNWGGCSNGYLSGQFIASALTFQATVTPSGGQPFSDRGSAWDNFNAYASTIGVGQASSFEYRAGWTSTGPGSGPADTTAPQLTVPDAITRESGDATAVTYDVSATDDTDATPAVSCDPPSGSTFPIGTTTVTCTATDAAGNTTEKSFDITVTRPADTTAPTLTVPDTITRDADGPSGTKVTYDVSATDDEDASPTVTCDPPSGSTFAIGTTTVTGTATDAAGNKSTRSFGVEVTGPEDSDGDGLSDVIEIMLGCNPHKADTDDDGISDYLEIVLETDPTQFDSNPDDDDTGGDGQHLHRIYGHRCGCGPEDDEDGDGVATWIELKWGTNPGSRVSYTGGGYSSEIDYIWHLCGCRPYAGEGEGGVPPMVRKRWGTRNTLTIIKRCGCHPWEDPHGGGTWRSFRIVTGGGGSTDDPDGDGLDTLTEEWLGRHPHKKGTAGAGPDGTRANWRGNHPPAG